MTDAYRPAIQQAIREGMTVEGPLSADTVFSKMLGGQYDIVVVMYHDQGHIPTKLQSLKALPTGSDWKAHMDRLTGLTDLQLTATG